MIKAKDPFSARKPKMQTEAKMVYFPGQCIDIEVLFAALMAMGNLLITLLILHDALLHETVAAVSMWAMITASSDAFGLALLPATLSSTCQRAMSNIMR